MNYKMVVFDLDGTLCNTLEDLYEACNYALVQCNLPKISLDQTRNFIGNGIKKLLLRASDSQGDLEELLKHFQFYYNQNFAVHTKAYSDIEEVLKYCKKKNLIVGVLTNKVETIAQKIIQTLFGNFFDFVYGEVPGRLKKPDPTFLLEIIRAYGLNSKEVLYIGDSEVDIRTTKNASIHGVFVSYGFRDKLELLQYTDCIAETPLDLIQYIGE